MHLVTGIAADWVEVLGGMPQAAIHQACVQYLRNEPRRRPTPGAILELARIAVPPPAIVRHPDPMPPQKRDLVTKEQRDAIMDEIGFRPKKYRGEDQ